MAGVLAAAGVTLFAAGGTPARAATLPAPSAARCVFWGAAHACQSTDPRVVLEVLNERETSQCTFQEGWRWGDGSPPEETTLRGSIEGSTQLLAGHTYTRPGTYTISVGGIVVSEEPGLDFICEAPPVEYTFTLLPVPVPVGGGGGGVLGVRESASPAPPLVVSDFSQSHRRWRSGSALARLARRGARRKAPVGTVFAFGLNEKASVKLSFAREAPGRRVGRACAPPTHRNRRRPRCRFPVAAGAMSFTARPGVNRAYFQGRLSVSQALGPGAYALTLTATDDAGRHSAPKVLRFTILG